MVSKKKNYIHKIRFICTHCKRERLVEVHDSMAVQPGTVIQSYSGGGNWGRCLFCKKKELTALEGVPIRKKEPVGWRRR